MADTSFFDATNDLICAMDNIQKSLVAHDNDDCEEWETMFKEKFNEEVSPSSIDLLSSMFMPPPPVLKDDDACAIENDQSEAPPRQKQIDELHMQDSTKDASSSKQNDDDLMSVAKRRIRREKNKTIKREEDRAGLGASGGAVQDNDAHASDEVDTPSTRYFDETEALTCFRDFRKEVQAFTEQEKGFGVGGRIPSDRLESFIARIESVYLQNNIDKLISAYHHDKAVRMKIKRVICSFAKRCKKNDLTMDKLNLFCNLLHNDRAAAPKEGKVLCKFKYWTCKLCGKNDLLFERNDCSVCGRPKRYRPLSPSHSVCESVGDPVRKEEQFLANDFASSLLGAHQTVRINEQVDLDIVDERLRRQYLYKKMDYDSEVRTALRNEVKDLLSFITKPITTSKTNDALPNAPQSKGHNVLLSTRSSFNFAEH